MLFETQMLVKLFSSYLTTETSSYKRKPFQVTLHLIPSVHTFDGYLNLYGSGSVLSKHVFRQNFKRTVSKIEELEMYMLNIVAFIFLSGDYFMLVCYSPISRVLSIYSF
jgi:hypothetical protein